MCPTLRVAEATKFVPDEFMGKYGRFHLVAEHFTQTDYANIHF
jgi:hypothetical protein